MKQGDAVNQLEKRQKNSKRYNCLIFCVATVTMAISVVFCALYWRLWNKADEFNESAFRQGYSGSVQAFDRCNSWTIFLQNQNVDERLLLDTKWSLVIVLNTIMYLSLSVFTLLMLVGALWWPLACGGSVGHCCGGWVQALVIILTGAYRYSEDGNLCA